MAEITTNVNDAAPATGKAPARPAVVHPAYVRITHWINAIAMIVMIGSGWEIYNASPLFGYTFPKSITLGGWLAGALLWHFAAMWVLVINGLIYVLLSLITGRFRRRLLPIRARDLLGDLDAAWRGRYANQDLAVYNTVQKILYIAVLVAGLTVVLSGLAIWKPVQLRPLTSLFGGYSAARYVHFYAMAAIVGFFILHVVMAIAFPKRLRTMLRGY